MGKVVTLRKTDTATLECSACGAPGEGSCQCGATYVPVMQRAAEAIKVNPGLSDYAIAKQSGIHRSSIQRARTSTSSDEPVDTRVGLDGITRQLPQRSEKPSHPSELATAQSHFREVMRMFKSELSKEAWKELVEWLRNHKW